MSPNATMDDARRILRSVFGFESFRPGQEAVIGTLLAGRSVLTVMPTGSGKSLCFQIPALLLDGLTVIVSPLVALMQDQVAALNMAGALAEAIHSGNGREANVAAWRRVAAGRARLLYMAPERLMTERMLEALGRLPVRMFVVDEAHCMSQWGPAFRPEYAGLARLRALFPMVPVAALTATADEVTRRDIVQTLFDGRVEEHVLGFDRPNISLAVEAKKDWKRQVSAFVDRHRGESGIVYCLSRRKTGETAAMLARQGVRALAYHAGMPAAEREANQNIFMTEPGVVMAATIAFGMGIDKADVRFVLHADLPGSVEAYYQEIGRAGRDGAPAEAHMLYGLPDIRMRRQFIEREDAGEDRRRRETARLDALVGYCEAPTCRRTVLLSWFGEHNVACGNCDVCRDPSGLVEGTAEARTIIQAALQTGNRFGAVHLIDVVRGAGTEKVRRLGHDNRAVFGTGARRGADSWRSVVRQMVAAGHLDIDIAGHGGMTVTESGMALLNGDARFMFREDGVLAAPSASRPRREGRKAAEQDLDDADAALLGALKKLRLEIAREMRKPAFVVFPDRSLIDMARRRPRTREEFALVSGVGDAKLRRFAGPFLAAIDEALTHAPD